MCWRLHSVRLAIIPLQYQTHRGVFESVHVHLHAPRKQSAWESERNENESSREPPYFQPSLWWWIQTVPSCPTVLDKSKWSESTHRGDQQFRHRSRRRNQTNDLSFFALWFLLSFQTVCILFIKQIILFILQSKWQFFCSNPKRSYIVFVFLCFRFAITKKMKTFVFCFSTFSTFSTFSDFQKNNAKCKQCYSKSKMFWVFRLVNWETVFVQKMCFYTKMSKIKRNFSTIKNKTQNAKQKTQIFLW